MSEQTGSGGLNEYIKHHLTHNTGEMFGGQFHFDTWLVGLGLGLVFLLWFGLAARKATAGVPTKGQAFVEIIFEFIDGQVKDTFHGDRRSVAPLALTIFMWVVFMNTMDLLPLDLPGWLVQTFAGAETAHHTYSRVVPTADLNTTFAMSMSVFFILLGHSITAKGGLGFGKELLTAPFHAHGVDGRGDGAGQPADEHHRVAGQAGFAGDATVRQHVRRRAGVHADRRPHRRAG